MPEYRDGRYLYVETYWFSLYLGRLCSGKLGVAARWFIDG